MQIRSQKDFASGLMFVIVGVIFASIATTYNMGTAAKMGPGYFPFWLGVLMAIIGAIITKTDEAAQLAPVLDCLIRHKLPLVFLSNGQRVPEDLSQANTAYLLHRALRPRAIGHDLELRAEHVPALMSDQLSNWSSQRSQA